MSKKNPLFERILAGFAPGMAANRAANRLRYQHIVKAGRAWEGSGTNYGRFRDALIGGDQNTQNADSLPIIRGRCRHLIRNSDRISGASDAFAALLVGTGIMPQLPEDVESIWNDWATDCDIEGRLTLSGLQFLLAETLFQTGEALIRIIPDRNLARAVPFKVQILEGDFLDLGKTEDLPRGAAIKNGIEYDRNGTIVAYWILPHHPDDDSFGALLQKSSRHAAESVIHIMNPRRPGQVRGMPLMAPVLAKLDDIKKYSEAEIQRKKLEACTGLFITQETDPAAGMSMFDNLQAKATAEQSGNETGTSAPVALSPGMVYQGRPGDKIEFLQPRAAGGFGEYIRICWEEAANPLMLTYEEISGDLRQTSFASLRGGRTTVRARRAAYRKRVIVDGFLQKIWRHFVRFAQLNPALRGMDFGPRPVWYGPKIDGVDNLKDAQAARLQLEGGLGTLAGTLRENGLDWRDVMRQRAEENRFAQELGLPLPYPPDPTGTPFVPDEEEQEEDEEGTTPEQPDNQPDRGRQENDEENA